MLYNYNEALKKYKDDYNIKKAVSNKEIYKIEKGIYSDTPNSITHPSGIQTKE